MFQNLSEFGISLDGKQACKTSKERSVENYMRSAVSKVRAQGTPARVEHEGNCRARKQFPYHNLVGPPTISQ